MKSVLRLFAVCVVLGGAMLSAQGAASAPQGPPAGGAPRLFVTTTAWPDGGEIPLRNASRGDNKSPAFTFNWVTANGATPSPAPATLQAYALIFHDVENSTMRT